MYTFTCTNPAPIWDYHGQWISGPLTATEARLFNAVAIVGELGTSDGGI